MDGGKTVLLISIVLGVSLSAMPQSPLPDTVKRSAEFPKIKSAQVHVEARLFIPDSLKTIWFLPHISDKPKIEYPNLAKQKGVQGTVLLILGYR